MSKSTPSLLALLGIAAMAGYQNRDKLGDMLGGGSRSGSTGAGGMAGLSGGGTGSGTGSGMGGAIGGLLGTLGGGGLAGGLSELMERFSQSGHRDRAESWIGTGGNQPVGQTELEQALGHDTLDQLAQTTGLSRSEIVERLSHNLPQTVDRFTPQGRLPTEDEAQGLL